MPDEGGRPERGDGKKKRERARKQAMEKRGQGEGNTMERLEPDHQEERQELLELKHDGSPGYRAAFFIALAVAVVYLVLVFWLSSHGSVH